MNTNISNVIDGDAVLEKTKPLLKMPPMYRVILMNDDYTPMDFVVWLLKSYFSMNDEIATRTMLQVHINGKGICGVFTKDVAETKVEQVNQVSRNSGHPLLCHLETT